MKLSLIVARSIDNVIGVDNKLPWHCPADLKHFKELTSRHYSAVVMGRHTWNSLPVRPLPGRVNIIVTSSSPEDMEPNNAVARDTKGFGTPIAVVSPSIQGAIDFGRGLGIDELIFIGGKQLYEGVVDLVDEVHLTEIPVVIGDDAGDTVTKFEHAFKIAIDWECLTHKEVSDDQGCKAFDYFHLKRIN